MEHIESPKSITFELMGLTNQLRKNADAITATHGGHKFSGMHCFILSFIYDERAKGIEVYQRDIEKEFYISRSTTSGILSLMEERGLITRCSVSQDARLKSLVPTEHGEALIGQIRSDLNHINDILDSALTPEEQQQMRHLLSKLWDAMDDVAESVGVVPMVRTVTPRPPIHLAAEEV